MEVRRGMLLLLLLLLLLQEQRIILLTGYAAGSIIRAVLLCRSPSSVASSHRGWRCSAGCDSEGCGGRVTMMMFGMRPWLSDGHRPCQ